MARRQSILNQNNNSFSLAYPLLSEHSNLVFSPLSIHVLLGMIAAGSKGPTRDQILGFVTATSLDELNAFFSQIVSKVLADGSPFGGPVLSTANGLWVDRTLTLKPTYRDLLHNVYSVDSQHVDFQHKAKKVIKRVNEWCNKETNELITNILPSNAVDHTTILLLANAVYFKGSWSRKFDASLTKDLDFHLLNGTRVRAPLMSARDKSQYFRAFDGFKVLKLPYEQREDTRKFSMYIYLPDAKDGLPALRERVCSQSGFINAHLPRDKEELDKFLVPKFKIGFEFEASDVLKKLGLVLPFEDGEVTEMVEMEPSSFPLEVSGMFHKSFIEVDEEGSTAAAVSLAGVRMMAWPGMWERKPPVEFVADHPFLFVIREDTTRIVLFIGQLLDPLHN